MKSLSNHIFISSDHAGIELKKRLYDYLLSAGEEVVDLGPHTEESVDYPDYAAKMAHAIKQSPNAKGILLCGTGIGMSIAANRYSHVRAALCHNVEYARLAREHNDANVLILGARFMLEDLAIQTVDVFLKTPFDGGRHNARVDKLLRLV